MTGIAIALAIGLNGDCVTVDRCLLARSVARYSKQDITAAEVLRQLSPAVVPCDPRCNSATADEDFYTAVQNALPVLARELRTQAPEAWAMAMALQQFADGALLEDLKATLAGAIEAQPRLFLRALPRPPGDQATIALLLDQSHIDDRAAQCRGWRQRLTSISSVQDEELREVRAVVVRRLLAVIESCE